MSKKPDAPLPVDIFDVYRRAYEAVLQGIRLSLEEHAVRDRYRTDVAKWRKEAS